MSSPTPSSSSASFYDSMTTDINYLNSLQSSLLKALSAASANPSGVSPSTFLMLQMQMAMVSQIGESISNIMSGMNSLISSIIRNMKG